MGYKDLEKQKGAKREWARKKRGKVLQGSTDVEPFVEPTLNSVEPLSNLVEPEVEPVEPKSRTHVEPFVEPSVIPSMKLLEIIATIRSDLDSFKSEIRDRITSVETQVQGIGEKLADVLASLEVEEAPVRSRGFGRGHSQKNVTKAGDFDDLPFSKARQAAGRLERQN